MIQYTGQPAGVTGSGSGPSCRVCWFSSRDSSSLMSFFGVFSWCSSSLVLQSFSPSVLQSAHLPKKQKHIFLSFCFAAFLFSNMFISLLCQQCLYQQVTKLLVSELGLPVITTLNNQHVYFSIVLSFIQVFLFVDQQSCLRRRNHARLDSTGYRQHCWETSIYRLNIYTEKKIIHPRRYIYQNFLNPGGSGSSQTSDTLEFTVSLCQSIKP